MSGHALECRVNAEDPVTFVPSPGVIRHFHFPGGPGVRVDTFAHEGCEITPYYDSLVAKIMTHGRDRREAIARMKRCLDLTVVEGIKTNIPSAQAHPRGRRLRGRAHRHPLHGALSGRSKGHAPLSMKEVRAGEPAPSGPPGSLRATGWAGRLGLLTLLALVSLAPDPQAALPRFTYFFRDLSITFYPVREFAAREMQAGRLPVWNPYIFEGAFAVPYFHLLDLLLVVGPDPAHLLVPALPPVSHRRSRRVRALARPGRGPGGGDGGGGDLLAGRPLSLLRQPLRLPAGPGRGASHRAHPSPGGVSGRSPGGGRGGGPGRRPHHPGRGVRRPGGPPRPGAGAPGHTLASRLATPGPGRSPRRGPQRHRPPAPPGPPAGNRARRRPHERGGARARDAAHRLAASPHARPLRPLVRSSADLLGSGLLSASSVLPESRTSVPWFWPWPGRACPSCPDAPASP